MKIKLIAVDMDGTLLHSGARLSVVTKWVLKLAIKRGIRIVPATGRSLDLLPQALEGISGIDYVITSNGAAVTELKSRTCIAVDYMKREVAEKLVSIGREIPALIEIYSDGKAYTEKRCFEEMDFSYAPKRVIEFMKFHLVPVENLLKEDKILDCVEKINFTFVYKDVYEDLVKNLGRCEAIEITSSVKGNIEINNKNVNKGTGLVKLSKHLKLEREETAAIGDGDNDSKMLQAAGIGVAMGNADANVKKCAEWKTLHHDLDGAAWAILRLMMRR